MMNIRQIALFAGLFAAAICQWKEAIAHDRVGVGYFLGWPTANQYLQAQGQYGELTGITYEWIAYPDGVAMTKALIEGEIDIAYSQGIVPFVAATSAGLPLRAVAIALSYSDNDLCYVREDANISQSNARDLEGQKIATPLGNVTYFRLLRMLEFLGVDINNIEILERTPKDAAKALVEGEAVMACAFGGPLEEMAQVGAPLMTGEELEAIGVVSFDLVTTTQDFIDLHPDYVKDFLTITEEVNKAFQDAPESMVEVIAGVARLDVETTKKIIAGFRFPTAEEQRKSTWFGGAIQLISKEIAEIMETSGDIEDALESYDTFFNSDYLPEAVDTLN